MLETAEMLIYDDLSVVDQESCVCIFEIYGMKPEVILTKFFLF